MTDSSGALETLLALVQDFTRADAVEVFVEATEGTMAVFARTGGALRVEADFAALHTDQSVIYCRDGDSPVNCADWVGSLIAVAIAGPSAESGWLVAAHRDSAHFDDAALVSLTTSARLVEYDLDRELERIRADELGVDIRKYQDQLREARDALEVSNRELEQFAYIAAHELLAPLRAVSMYAEVLSTFTTTDVPTSAQAVTCAEAIRSGVDDMTEQVRYLLSLSQIQDSATALGEVDVADVVYGALDSLAEPIESCGAQITVGELPVVMAKEIPLQSVIANIVRNAIRYRHPDRSLTVDISSKPTETGSRISFADNGQGINPQDHARIFGMFERAADTAEGSGIGLALSRRILTVFNARIGVEDNDAHGATFWIDFDRSAA